MSLAAVVVLVLVVVSVIYVIGIYNGLVGLKNSVSKAWANIDVLLKQRHDEIPKLVDTCKAYMKHERETLEGVMRARAAVATASDAEDMRALGTAESALRQGLGKLFALAEAYPDLKAVDQFNHLQNRITGLENAIADRREFYNDSVNLNNVGVQEFPAVLIANLFGFGSRQLLRFSAEETADVNVQALFRSA
jgi:LemA protein